MSAYAPSSVLLSWLPTFTFPSVGSFLVPTLTRDPETLESEEIFAPSSNPALLNVPCRIAPTILIRATGQEPTTDSGTESITDYTIMLKGFRPEITESMRFQVGSLVYQVVGRPGHDGNMIYTRFLGRLIS